MRIAGGSVVGSAERRASTDDLLAKIDAVTTGHELQHSHEHGLPVEIERRAPVPRASPDGGHLYGLVRVPIPTPEPFLAPAIEAARDTFLPPDVPGLVSWLDPSRVETYPWQPTPNRQIENPFRDSNGEETP